MTTRHARSRPFSPLVGLRRRVVIPLTTEHYTMLQRNLIYNARDPGQGPRRPGWPAAGARDCDKGRADKAAMVETLRVARAISAGLEPGYLSSTKMTRHEKCQIDPRAAGAGGRHADALHISLRRGGRFRSRLRLPVHRPLVIGPNTAQKSGLRARGERACGKATRHV